jgi:Na+-driven multidrug efflux pump
VIASPLLFRIFQSDATVLGLAMQITPWMAGSSALAIPVFVIGNVMTASGFSVRSLILTAVRIYALSVPACALGAYVIGKNVSSVMIGIVIASGLGLGVNLLARRDFFSRLFSGRLQIRLPAQQSGTAD